MTAPDFPYNPTVGQTYTTPSGLVYTWSGQAWTFGFYDSPTQQFAVVGDLLDQIRTLLQDTDNSATSGYRYSTDSIITALNQGMMEMYRLRKDLFLENSFRLPVFSTGLLSAPVIVEQQYVPLLIYYTVGMVQLRDDEQNQDARGQAFVKTFSASLVSLG